MAREKLNATAELISPGCAEEESRAGVYFLLGTLLRDAPTLEVVQQVRQLCGAHGRNGFALAWEGLRLSAQSVHTDELQDEFQELFIGLGRGELVPYGSWYQTGFLMEKPLGELRRDLRSLGFERRPGVYEPEDHIAALCEVMARMAMDAQVPVERQRDFFEAHIGPWAERFCADLERAHAALFYKSVARLAGEFFALERRYLEMDG